MFSPATNADFHLAAEPVEVPSVQRRRTPRQPSSTVVSVKLMSWGEMDRVDRQRWNELRGTQPKMTSPFFSTQFIDAVHRSRGDVDVAVLGNGHQTIGYWAMHRINGVAKPVGRFLNDAHNVVAAPQIEIDWRWLLKECQVVAFDFHSLVGDASHLEHGMIDGYHQSFAANISRRAGCFVDSMEQSHRTMRKQNQKTRKMARECGPLRFEIDCRDPAVLQTAIAWKRDQYQRTHILDLFGPTWTRRMLQQMHRLEDNHSCHGMVSALWAGDQLVATHIGMREGKLLHYWFPSYNETFARYSPGTALFKEIAKHACQHGIETIDMGYGAQPYKRKQTDVITTVAHGCVTYSPWVRSKRRMMNKALHLRKDLPMRSTLKRVLRAVIPSAGIGKLT